MSTELRVEGLKQGRRFTADQKLAMLREWERSGNGVEVAAKYQVHPQTLYRWKKCLDVGARELLRGVRRKKSQELRRLEEENQKLKEALVLQSQELMLLKKEMNLV